MGKYELKLIKKTRNSEVYCCPTYILLVTHNKILLLLGRFVQVRLSKSRLSIGVFRVLLQQFHDVIVELKRRCSDPRRPVIDVPIVGRQIDELIVLAKHLLVHWGQIFGRKRAQQKTILKHTSFTWLIQQSRFSLLHRLSQLFLIGWYFRFIACWENLFRHRSDRVHNGLRYA